MQILERLKQKRKNGKQHPYLAKLPENTVELVEAAVDNKIARPNPNLPPNPNGIWIYNDDTIKKSEGLGMGDQELYWRVTNGIGIYMLLTLKLYLENPTYPTPGALFYLMAFSAVLLVTNRVGFAKKVNAQSYDDKQSLAKLNSLLELQAAEDNTSPEELAEQKRIVEAAHKKTVEETFALPVLDALQSGFSWAAVLGVIFPVLGARESLYGGAETEIIMLTTIAFPLLMVLLSRFASTSIRRHHKNRVVDAFMGATEGQRLRDEVKDKDDEEDEDDDNSYHKLRLSK